MRRRNMRPRVEPLRRYGGRSPRCRQREPHLLEFPNEILEHLARFLDRESLYSFAAANRRLGGICRSSRFSVERVRTSIIHKCVSQFLDQRALEVRVLDLSHCWSNSLAIKTFILNFSMIEELNVVGSSISTNHLLTVLGRLQHVKTLSVTITRPSRQLGRYPSVITLYVEFPPDHLITHFVFELVEHCCNIANVHFNIIGAAENAINEDTHGLTNQTVDILESIVLSTEMRSRWEEFRVDPLVFNHARFIDNQGLPYALTRELRWYEEQNIDEDEELVADPAPGTLSHLYKKLDFVIDTNHLRFPDKYRDGQLAIRVEYLVCGTKICMPSLRMLSCLKELDFTQCHFQYPSSAWDSLVDSSAAVEAMALPICAFFKNKEFGKSPVISPNAMKALRRLKLRKLYVDSGEADCIVYDRQLTGCFSVYLSDFVHLQELTLKDVRVSPCFFTALREPCSVRTLKLKVSSFGDLAELETFLELFTNLTHLKLEAPDLPLHDVVLWELFTPLRLKQLCLSSQSEHPIRMPMLTDKLHRLLKFLDVIHVHGERLANRDRVCQALRQKASHWNSRRTYRPLLFRGPNCRSLSDMEDVLYPNIPGRALCCMKNFIALVKPVGWEVEY